MISRVAPSWAMLEHGEKLRHVKIGEGHSTGTQRNNNNWRLCTGERNSGRPRRRMVYSRRLAPNSPAPHRASSSSILRASRVSQSRSFAGVNARPAAALPSPSSSKRRQKRDELLRLCSVLPAVLSSQPSLPLLPLVCAWRRRRQRLADKPQMNVANMPMPITSPDA